MYNTIELNSSQDNFDYSFFSGSGAESFATSVLTPSLRKAAIATPKINIVVNTPPSWPKKKSTMAKIIAAPAVR